MMKPIRFRTVVAAALALVALALAQASTDTEPTNQVRFSWWQPGAAQAITLSLPVDIAADQLERVSLAGVGGQGGGEQGGGEESVREQGAGKPAGGELAGFMLQVEPPLLRIYPVPSGDELTFGAVDLELGSGGERRFDFGIATVVSIVGGDGELSFEKSLSAEAAGLYQAVAVSNDGKDELVLEAARFLPDPLDEGRLLVAQGAPVGLLERIERAMSPTEMREARRKGGSYPLLEGFEWRSAEDLNLRLAPGEAGVIVWTDAALPSTTGATDFELRPVIDYRVAGRQTPQSLGLPVVVRSSR